LPTFNALRKSQDPKSPDGNNKVVDAFDYLREPGQLLGIEKEKA